MDLEENRYPDPYRINLNPVDPELNPIAPEGPVIPNIPEVIPEPIPEVIPEDPELLEPEPEVIPPEIIEDRYRRYRIIEGLTIVLDVTPRYRMLLLRKPCHT